ncbi:TetR/AcrR family transcriptional regulator [Thalassolituus sp. LLYu03]|uniref:TetR/AcrR family transcriptional regulator n=1 Tax=Thalassolituus sp. LLYu03 TaxID=3421656 RepID=UPI003D2C2B4C
MMFSLILNRVRHWLQPLLNTTPDWPESHALLASGVAPGPYPVVGADPDQRPANLMLMTDKSARGVFGLRFGPASCPIKKSKAEKLAEREKELLDLAEQLINQDGFAAFTMDRLVAASGYSKGTLYNHFSSKEDCLAGLCIRGMSLMEHLFQRAATFDGNARERVLALHYADQLYARLQPTLSLAVLSARTPAFAEKISAERDALMQETDCRVTGMVDEVFRQALHTGDLPQRDDIPVEAMTFICWAQAFGTGALLGTARDLTAVSRIASMNIPLLSANVVLDGFGFKPLSDDWDYAASWERIGQTCFSAELAVLAAQPDVFAVPNP